MGRARGPLWLRGLANADKRVCLVGYDCPVREGNLLAVSQFDVTESIAAILVEPHRTGYRIQPVTAAWLHANLMMDQVNFPAYLIEVQSLVYPHRQAQADFGDQQA